MTKIATCRVLLAAAAVAALEAQCTAARFGTLESVLKQDRVAAGGEIQDVQVIREGALVPTALRMEIMKGDEIVTDDDTRAVVTFAAGYEVTLAPNTQIVIRNPSIFMRVGRVFVRTLGRVREALKVENPYATAGAEGTEFLVAVERDSVLTLTVVEGRVRVESKTASWAPRSYGPSEQTTIEGQAPPEEPVRLDARQLADLVRWVEDVERLTKVEVPRLVGLPIEQATALIRDSGLSAGRTQYGMTGGTAPGTVVTQNPPPGAVVRVGARVDLLVEAESVIVPQIVGQTVDQARGSLADVGLRLGRITEEPSDSQREGTILRQSPRPGERVEPGQAVDVRVAAAGVSVPDVIGLDVREAEVRLREARLQARVSTVEERQHEPGTVVRQSPSPGTLVRSGHPVDLFIAAAADCVVPDLTGLSVREASSRLARARLRLGEVQSLEAGDTISEQRPTAGTSVDCGSRVDVTVGYIG